MSNFRASIPVLFSDRLSVPVVCGGLKPAILLPRDATRWSDDHLRSVFLHEMAHIRRGDEITSTIVWLAAVWQWFNPVVWMALRQCRIEREKACDDFAITAGIPDVDYADHLVATGQSAATARCMALAGLPMVPQRNIEKRLVDILDGTKNRQGTSIGTMSLTALMITCLIIPVASLDVKSQDYRLSTLAAADKITITKTLRDFYDALSRGVTIQQVCDRFLSAAYFDPPHLTLENRNQGDWDTIRKHMTSSLYNMKLRFRPMMISRIADMRFEDGRCVVTQHWNIINKNDTGPDLYFARNLPSEVELIKEDGQWKISRYDDGLALMRRDIGRESGPGFLFWVDDRGDDMTPMGSVVFDVVPDELRSNEKPYLCIRQEE